MESFISDPLSITSASVLDAGTAASKVGSNPQCSPSAADSSSGISEPQAVQRIGCVPAATGTAASRRQCGQVKGIKVPSSRIKQSFRHTFVTGWALWRRRPSEKTARTTRRHAGRCVGVPGRQPAAGQDRQGRCNRRTSRVPRFVDQTTGSESDKSCARCLWYATERWKRTTTNSSLVLLPCGWSRVRSTATNSNGTGRSGRRRSFEGLVASCWKLASRLGSP